MESLRICVLGELRAMRGAEPLDLGSTKQRAVFGLLAKAAPDPVPLELLTDELWGSSPPSDPRRNLQVHVSALRRALGADPSPLQAAPGGYRLAVRPEQVDAHVFEQAVADAARTLEAGEAAAVVERLEGALDLWRGAAWQGLHDVRTLATDADRLEERRRGAQALLARARLAVGRHLEAIPELHALLAERPLDEEVRHDLVLALHRAGRRDEALTCYREGRRAAVDATGLEPGARLQQLHAQVLADDPALRVEDPALRARRHLPAPLTRLVGREREVSEVLDLVTEGDVRLLTLVGTGGVGKTRVALAAGHAAAASFPDGVWFVGLSEIAGSDLVPEAVAAALGVDIGSGGASAALSAHLADRQLLLVVDNFEHVEAAGPLLTELLSRAPGLRILVTSRVRLRLYGEHVVPLEPLPATDAVPLFVERARAADHQFDPGLGDDVSAVCRALDHLPLALELVAARVDRLPLASILVGLTEDSGRLDLAAEGPRDRTGRQQTLRGAIEWSVNLLDPGTAVGFRKLSVFLGGFEPDAAETVAGVTADALDRLVRASLLTRDPAGGRCWMLGTVREHALESLPAAARDEVRRAHAHWFHRLARESTGGMRGPEMRSWLSRLRAERANMRVALDWWAEEVAQDPDAGTRLLEMTGSLGLFWYRDSPGSADVEWLTTALRLGAGADPALRARAWYALAICRAEQGRAEEALDHGRRCRELLPADDDTWRARVLNTLGGIARDLGRPDEAAPMLDETIELRRRIDDPTLSVPIALANRAMVARDLGQLDLARTCLLECLTVAEADDDQVDRAAAQLGLAEVAVAEGDAPGARHLLDECSTAFTDLQQDYRLIECLESYAATAVLEGRPELAATLVAAADRALAEDGSALVPADRALRDARVGQHLSRLPAAVVAAATARGRELALDEAITLARGAPGGS